MMKSRRQMANSWGVLSAAALALAGSILAGCSEKVTGVTVYCSPVADAGNDQSVTLGLPVTLDGSASGTSSAEGGDCEQHDVAYNWDFESVPAGSAIGSASLSDNNTQAAVSPEFLPDAPGTYVIALTVCDDVECSGPDVVVIDVAAGDAAPIAIAGPDQTGEVGERVQMDGSESYDPDGDPLTYAWTLAEVPDCSALVSSGGDVGGIGIYNPGAAIASVVPDCEGLYLVSLVVSDGDQWSAPDYATITVATGNQLPVADAGPSTTATPCTGDEIQLDGHGSYDPEGASLDFHWELVGKPEGSASGPASFSDASLADPTFTWDVPGTYTFQLEVFDGEDWSAPDIVTWEMVDDKLNTAPTASAGEHASLELTATCSEDSYTYDCEDCPAGEFLVDATESFDDDGDELSFFWWDDTGELTIDSPYTAVTAVHTPPLAAQYNTDISVGWNLNLRVSDCANDSETFIRLSVVCTGER